jgi:hypothetical protein
MKAFVLAKLISAMIFVESGGDPLSFNAREQEIMLLIREKETIKKQLDFLELIV